MKLQKTETDYAADRYALFDKLGLEYSAEFVPFSKSRNRDDKDKSLNWRVTFKRGNQKFTTDYSQGVGHIPSYSHQYARLVVYDNAVKEACETGKSRIVKRKNGYDAAQGGRTIPARRPIPAPTRDDIMYSLVMDSSVIDFPTYEEWARGCGYDEDSRSGEKVYRACLEIALKLRALIGDENISKFQEYYQDY